MTVTISGATAGVTGTLSAVTVNGIAQFSDVRLTKIVGPHVLSASSPGLASATYNRHFQVSPGPVTRMAFANVWSASYDFPSVNFKIDFRDAYDNVVTSGSSFNFSIELTGGPGGATTSWTSSSASYGPADRSVMISKPGTNYQLRAYSGIISTGFSPSFALTATPASVSAAGSHTCAVTTKSSLFCWGGNNFGQLGIGATSTTPENRPRPVSPFENWHAVSASSNSTCGFRGPYYPKLACWGRDAALGGASTSAPRDIPLAAGVSQPSSPSSDTMIATGNNHACAHWYQSGLQRLKCWGSNTVGATGLATFTGIAASATPVVSTISYWSSLTAGANHTCAIESQYGYCWGANSQKQLGLASLASKNTPTLIPGGLRWNRLSAGDFFTCGINLVTKAAHCWGNNDRAQLGAGTTTGNSFVIPARTFTQISAGSKHACGIEQTQSHVYCWGSNERGQIGNGTFAPSANSAPYQVKIGTTPLVAKAISAGKAHTCAVSTANVLYCWGANEAAQLGLGDTTQRNVPTAVSF